MTGYSAEEVVGKKSCEVLQKNESKTKSLQGMMEEIRFKRPTAATLVNYKKSGDRFRHFLLLFPLSTDSRITHYLSLTTHTDTGELPQADGAAATDTVAQAAPQAILPAASSQGQTYPQQSIVPPILFTGLQTVQGAVGTGPQGQITLPSHILPNSSLVPSMQMPPPSSHTSTTKTKGTT